MISFLQKLILCGYFFFRDGDPYIYSVMNWEQPRTALYTFIGALVLATFIHFTFFYIYKLRVFVQQRYFTESTNRQIVFFD